MRRDPILLKKLINSFLKVNKLIPPRPLNLKEGTYKLDKRRKEDALGGGKSYSPFVVSIITTTFATLYIGL